MNRKDKSFNKSPSVDEEDIACLEALIRKWEKSTTQLQKAAVINKELEIAFFEKQTRNRTHLETKQPIVTNKALKNSPSNVKTSSKSSMSSLQQRNTPLVPKVYSSKTSISSRKSNNESDSELIIKKRIERFYEVRRRIQKMNNKCVEEKAFLTLLETESIIN